MLRLARRISIGSIRNTNGEKYLVLHRVWKVTIAPRDPSAQEAPTHMDESRNLGRISSYLLFGWRCTRYDIGLSSFDFFSVPFPSTCREWTCIESALFLHWFLSEVDRFRFIQREIERERRMRIKRREIKKRDKAIKFFPLFNPIA